MDLKVETQIILFDISQMNSQFHPLTCSGGGGYCKTESLLKARHVKGTDKIEAYCPVCGYKQDLYTSQSNMDFVYQTETFQY